MKDTSVPTFSGNGKAIIVSLPTASYLLLESGGKILQENGGGFLLESSQTSSLYNDSIPSLAITATQALLEDQGYTYNQAGFTYNQAGVAYGGVYNTDQDNIPMDMLFSDIYTQYILPPLNNDQSIGPGWFMFITH